MSDFYFPAIGETVRAKVGDQIGNEGTVARHDPSSIVPILVQFGNRGPARYYKPDELELVPEKVTEAKILCSLIYGAAPVAYEEFENHSGMVRVNATAGDNVWLRIDSHDGRQSVGVWLTPEAWAQLTQVRP